MNLFSRAHQAYQNFILDKVPHPLKHLKFLLILLVILTVPLTIILGQNVQDLRQRASEGPSFAGVPDIDPITKELYDINIWGTPTTRIIKDNYYADVAFKISGTRIKNLPALYAVRQKDNTFEKLITFNRKQDGEYVEFSTNNPVTTWQNEQACLDLYSSGDFKESSYIASFCYNPILLTKSQERRGVSSMNAHHAVTFIYDNETPSFAITIQSAFSKQNGSVHWHHVNFFGYDQSIPASSFKKVVFLGQWINSGILNNTNGQLCNVDMTYFKTSQMVKPEGGANVAVQREGAGGCSFEYDSPVFLPHYQSLDTKLNPGGYYAYLASLMATPTPASRPIATPSAYPTVYATPTSIPKPSPYPTIFMSPTPTPQVMVKPPCQQYGDANLDGYISNSDIELIQKFIVNLEIPNSSQKKFSDVNGDGQLTVSDLVLVRSILAGTISTFPVCSSPSTPTPTPQSQTPMSLKTGYVTLTANDFTLNIGGKIYKAPTKYTRLSSDPGGNLGKYTTLEAEWIAENGAEMRMNMYFAYDGTFWYLSELRTYNGNSPADWLYYKPVDQFGQKVQHVLGQTAITPEITFKSPTSSLKFTNLALRAFTNSSVPTPTPTYGISPTPTMRPSSTPTPTAFRCDFNKDKYLDILDYNIWLRQFINGGRPTTPSADCDRNGSVDIFDYNLWLKEFRGFKR